jgi:hypothetical protein
MLLPIDRLCAQARLGFTEADIRKMDGHLTYERFYSDNGNKYLSTETDDGVLQHIFNEHSISTASLQHSASRAFGFAPLTFLRFAA